MKDDKFTPYWPIKLGRERDLYFYNEAIDYYHPDGKVHVSGHGDMIMLGSYSYLGLLGHPKIMQAAKDSIDRYGTGTHGVRLLAGTLDLHIQLEDRVAKFKSTESAVIFSSGYFANVSTISSIVGKDDTVICDKHVHASIVDGCLLSRSKFVRYHHNDMDHLEKCLRESKNPGLKLVIVDAVFSMDGDIINLPEVSWLCKKYNALLMVDEAHSIGVLGRTGHGIEEHFNLPTDCVDIKMGTFSKAIPSIGGYIAGSHKLCDFLRHESSGFIYSASIPPPAAAAALVAFDIIEEESDRIHRLHNNIKHFIKNLKDTGFYTMNSTTAIVPIICGDDWLAYKLARCCQKRGIYIQAIPHPVVPKGKARLRAIVNANHTLKDLDHCGLILREEAENIGGIIK